MLGHRDRRPFVAAEDDHYVLKGGGMLKPVVLVDGIVTGTWSIQKRRVTPAWFGRSPTPTALAREAADIERFLAS
jgi:hypothetical protein